MQKAVYRDLSSWIIIECVSVPLTPKLGDVLLSRGVTVSALTYESKDFEFKSRRNNKRNTGNCAVGKRSRLSVETNSSAQVRSSDYRTRYRT